MSETRLNEVDWRRVLMHFYVVTNKDRRDIRDASLARHMNLPVAKDLLRRSVPQEAISHLRGRRWTKLARVLAPIEIHRIGYQRAQS
jgi:hypothetical protein